MNLLESLKPVYSADNQEWQELIDEVDGNIPPLFWYGGAAFDREPVIALFNGSFPEDVQTYLSPNIFPVLTDYDSNIVKAIKDIYKKFDEVDFTLKTIPGDYWFISQLLGIKILQMIPLTLFDVKTLKQIRQEYQDFHPSITSSVVPDDQWHFVFIKMELDGQERNVVYGLIENLTFWKEVVEGYDLDIEAFCALRVGGKSGSWDHTHSPKTGKLFDSIRMSKSKKPRVWIADNCLELREIWREISPHENGFYGQMHFFEATWSKE